ncbi:604_t:CDS:2 [Paraglomus occultum]|uniref:604_t:CDS:1 n=1 Tax=Paraglomus occultum TaxID=144539 RepID=A0A9N9G3L1_9GLOM|nr:604_t:CDS:2 [Paraglomus occultum]
MVPMYASTEEVLRTILPDASKKDIEKYSQQLEDVEDFDPVSLSLYDHEKQPQQLF